MFRLLKRLIFGFVFGFIVAVIFAVLFGEGGVIFGLIIGFYIGFTFKSKGNTSSYDSSYSVSDDSEMTRWGNYYCKSCAKTTNHKVYRHTQGSKDADYQCKVCGGGYVGRW